MLVVGRVRKVNHNDSFLSVRGDTHMAAMARHTSTSQASAR